MTIDDLTNSKAAWKMFRDYGGVREPVDKEIFGSTLKQFGSMAVIMALDRCRMVGSGEVTAKRVRFFAAEAARTHGLKRPSQPVSTYSTTKDQREATEYLEAAGYKRHIAIKRVRGKTGTVEEIVKAVLAEGGPSESR